MSEIYFRVAMINQYSSRNEVLRYHSVFKGSILQNAATLYSMIVLYYISSVMLSVAESRQAKLFIA